MNSPMPTKPTIPDDPLGDPPRDAHGGPPCDAPTLDALNAHHERFEQALDALRGLTNRLRTAGPDEAARDAAAQVVAALDGEAPGHRATEERAVLPLLRRAGGAGGATLAARLEAEHDLITRAWSHCRPALVDLATHGRWAAESADIEFERWRDLAALATAHLLAEQGAAFPAVRALIEGPTPGR